MDLVCTSLSTHASKRKTSSPPIWPVCNMIRTLPAYPCNLQYDIYAHLLQRLCCDLTVSIYATWKILCSQQKNFLILTARKKPLKGSRDAHVIELISTSKLQQHTSHGKGEPNRVVVLKLDWVPDPSRGACGNQNLTRSSQRLSALTPLQILSVSSCSGIGWSISSITNYQ